MKIRVTWNDSSPGLHPVLGPLTPGQTTEHDVDAELVAALRTDTSGLFTLETEEA